MSREARSGQLVLIGCVIAVGVLVLALIMVWILVRDGAVH